MRLILASALVFVAFAPANATTFVSASVDVGTNATLDTASDPQSSSMSTAVLPLSLGAATSSIVTNGGYSVASYAGSSATWSSANAGTIDIRWGWVVRAGGSGFTTVAETNQTGTNWTYTFTASGNGSFDGRFAVTGSGDKFGLQSLYSTADLASVSFGGTVFDPTSSGTFSVPLLNGQTYTMAVFNYGNVGNVGGFDANGGAIADIDWSINYVGGTVPEPASWALMIAGFGLVGAAARRRRSTGVLA